MGPDAMPQPKTAARRQRHKVTAQPQSLGWSSAQAAENAKNICLGGVEQEKEWRVSLKEKHDGPASRS